MVRVAACLALAALAGCAPSFPPIADTGSDLAFKARIAKNHGPGTSAAALRAELLAEGFVVADEPGTGFASALFRPANLPCYSETRIDWREDRRGRIRVIQATRHPCS